MWNIKDLFRTDFLRFPLEAAPEVKLHLFILKNDHRSAQNLQEAWKAITFAIPEDQTLEASKR